MSSLRAAAAIFLAAGLLAACHKPAGRSASGAAHAPQAGAGGGDVVIAETDLPHPRPGQWEMVNADTAAGPGTRNRFCVSDRPLNLGRMRAHCQKLVIHRSLMGGIVMDSECNAGGVASKIHVAAQGDFQSAYSTDMEMSFTLRPGETPHISKTHTDYRYVGPCPPDEQAAADAAARSTQ